jgi:hypothetical protein
MAIGEWQEGDDPFETKRDAATAKKENSDAALIFAQKYKVFETGVAKELLDHWTRTVRYKKIAPSASATEFAYHAGFREFVESIHLQLELANNGGLSPYIKDR